QVALDQLADAGARLVEVAIPHAVHAPAAVWVTAMAEGYAYHEADLQQRPHLYGRYTRQTLQRGMLYSAPDYVQAQRVRALLKEECAAALADVDVLITPTMPGTAPSFAAADPMRTDPPFTPLWNLTGLPALSVPCGFSAT